MREKIFLNYRRSDAEAWADRVFERLKGRLPNATIFMDIDGNLPLGLPWATWLDSQVAACDVMLVLIGNTWVDEFRARSGPDERDYVRAEIESALSRKIPVVPVFLGDAPIPSPSNIPESIRPLLGLQAARLQRVSFETDIKALIDGVVRSLTLTHGSELRQPSARLPWLPIAAGVLGIVLVALIGARFAGMPVPWSSSGEDRTGEIARPKIERDVATPPTSTKSLLGTEWWGTSDNRDMTFRFKADGILNYTSPSGTFNDGTWKQTGSTVVLNMNKNYATYTGTVETNRIWGSAENVTGHKWTFEVLKTK